MECYDSTSFRLKLRMLRILRILKSEGLFGAKFGLILSFLKEILSFCSSQLDMDTWNMQLNPLHKT